MRKCSADITVLIQYLYPSVGQWSRCNRDKSRPPGSSPATPARHYWTTTSRRTDPSMTSYPSRYDDTIFLNSRV